MPLITQPHALRRGGITYALSEGWPMKAVGDRANVSETVLDMHYDSRSEEEKWSNEDSTSMICDYTV